MVPQSLAPDPLYVLCVLSSGVDLAGIGKIAAESGGLVLDEESRAGHDPRMDEAFRASLSTPTFTDEDFAAVAAHDTVVYVRTVTFIPEVAELIARRTLSAVGALLRNGATAVKCESSGITHGRQRWLELADLVDGTEDPAVAAVWLYQAWVQQPIVSGTVAYSCGMHLLGRPDVEIDFAERPQFDSPQQWRELIDALALYMLTEERGGQIEDGEGFRTSADSPRWALQRVDCERYDSDDIAYNPWGYWRLSPA